MKALEIPLYCVREGLLLRTRKPYIVLMNINLFALIYLYNEYNDVPDGWRIHHVGGYFHDLTE